MPNIMVAAVLEKDKLSLSAPGILASLTAERYHMVCQPYEPKAGERL